GVDDRRGASEVLREAARGGAGRLAVDQRQVLAVGLDARLHARPEEALRSLHGWNPRSVSRPSVSGQPKTRLRFCTACPAAPLTRLSMAEMAITVSPSQRTASWQRLVPTTALRPTSSGDSSTSMNGRS